MGRNVGIPWLASVGGGQAAQLANGCLSMSGIEFAGFCQSTLDMVQLHLVEA